MQHSRLNVQVNLTIGKLLLINQNLRKVMHLKGLNVFPCPPRNYLLKTLLIMKFLSILLLAAALQLSANGVAQRITLSQDNVTLDHVFTEIRKQTGYEFLYNSAMLARAKKVTIDVKGASLQEVLEICFRDQPFTYKLNEKTIIVRRVETVEVSRLPVPPVVVRGKVTNEKNEPIAGASVNIKGTKAGTVTNKDGDFLITIPDRDAVLVISFVGYSSREVKAPNDGLLRITLQVKPDEMETVVTTGLFKRPKESFSGSVTTVNGDQIRQINMVSPLDALKLFDPAMRIPDNVQFGSDPNRLPTITLRGTNNFPQQGTGAVGSDIPSSGADFMSSYATNPSQPLFILDGFQVSLQKIYDLDINRIASFTILKDAAATAMYGSRAANGVIVVETKQPATGKLRASYSGMVQVTAPDLTVYDLLDAREKLEVEKLAGIYSQYADGIRPDADAFWRDLYSKRLQRVEEGVNTYWLAQPVRTGFGQRHSIFLEGGDQFLRYGLDFGYNNNVGVMKNSNRNTYTGGMNISYRRGKLLFKNVLSVAFNNAKNSNYGAFSEYSRMNQYWAPYDENGNVVKILESYRDPISSATVNYTNPLYNATLNTRDVSQYTNIVNQSNIEWALSPEIKLTGRLGINKQTDKADRFLPAQHTSFETQADYTRRGSYRRTNSDFFSYDGSAQFDYVKRLGNHQLFNTTGISVAQTTSESAAILVEGFPNDRLDQLLFGNAYPPNSKPSGSLTITRRFSAFSNFNYNYRNKYQADFTVSSDGASQFGSEKRFGTFWSSGVSWNLHKEHFFKINNVEEFRVRATLGTTGDNNFPPNQAITSYQYFTDQNYRGQVGSLLIGYGNSGLKWQQNLKRNIGVNVVAFDGRISGRFDLYRETTSDLILDINTAPSEGVSSYKENLGKLQNDGYEFNLNVVLLRNVKKKTFWTVYVNGNHNRDRIKSISNSLKKQNQLNDQTGNNKQVQPQFRYEEGLSVNSIWAVQSLGIDPASGRELYLKRNGAVTYDWDPLDKVIVGNSVPDMRGSFGTNFSYSGLSLGVYFSYEFGGQLYNQTLLNRVEDAPMEWQVDRRMLEGRWKKPGDVTYFKGLVDINGRTVTSRTFATSRFVQDNNFVNCETISLTYQLPEKINKLLSVQNARVSFISNDIRRWSSIQVERGLDYPFARNFTLNLSATF